MHGIPRFRRIAAGIWQHFGGRTEKNRLTLMVRRRMRESIPAWAARVFARKVFLCVRPQCRAPVTPEGRASKMAATNFPAHSIPYPRREYRRIARSIVLLLYYTIPAPGMQLFLHAPRLRLLQAVRRKTKSAERSGIVSDAHAESQGRGRTGKVGCKADGKNGGRPACCSLFCPLALRSALCAFDGALHGTDLLETASVRRGRRMDELRQTDGGAAPDGWRRCGRRRRRQPLLSCPQEKTREPVPDSGRLLRSALILPAGEDAGAERPSERVRSG